MDEPTLPFILTAETVAFEYDDQGRVTILHVNGMPVEPHRDDAGRLAHVRTPSLDTEILRDVNGRITGHLGAAGKFAYRCDSQGRLAEIGRA